MKKILLFLLTVTVTAFSHTNQPYIMYHPPGKNLKIELLVLKTALKQMTAFSPHFACVAGSIGYATWKFLEYRDYKPFRADPTVNLDQWYNPIIIPDTFAEKAPARNKFWLSMLPVAASAGCFYALTQGHWAQYIPGILCTAVSATGSGYCAKKSFDDYKKYKTTGNYLYLTDYSEKAFGAIGLGLLASYFAYATRVVSTPNLFKHPRFVKDLT